jgi:hypothetical protein
MPSATAPLPLSLASRRTGHGILFVMKHGQSRFSATTRVFVIVAIVILFVAGAAIVLWYFSGQRIYGRIVDESGSPIVGATVTYRVHYANFYRPEGTPERYRFIECETDSNGDYCVRRIDGTGIDMIGVKVENRMLESAMGVPCPVETGWGLTDRSQVQRMPQTARQRITYSFKR